MTSKASPASIDLSLASSAAQAAAPASAPAVSSTRCKVASAVGSVFLSLGIIAGAVALSLVPLSPLAIGLVSVGILLAACLLIACCSSLSLKYDTIEHAKKMGMDFSNLGSKSGNYLSYDPARGLRIVHLNALDQLLRKMGHPAYAGTHLTTAVTGLRDEALKQVAQAERNQLDRTQPQPKSLELPMELLRTMQFRWKKANPTVPFMSWSCPNLSSQIAKAYQKEGSWNLKGLRDQLVNDIDFGRASVRLNGKTITSSDELFAELNLQRLFAGVPQSQEPVWKPEADMSPAEATALEFTVVLQQGIAEAVAAPLFYMGELEGTLLIGKGVSDDQKAAHKFINDCARIQKEEDLPTALPSSENSNLLSYLYNSRAALPPKVRDLFPPDFQPSHSFGAFSTQIDARYSGVGGTATAHQHFAAKNCKNPENREYPDAVGTVQVDLDGSATISWDFV